MSERKSGYDSTEKTGARLGTLGPMLLIGVAAFAWVFLMADPAKQVVLPPCTLYRQTGLLCAGCGGTRAVFHLAHGRVGSAFRCNAFFVLLVPVIALYGLRHLFGETFPFRLPSLSFTPRTVTTLLVLALLFTIVRNIPRYPWNLLAPLP